MPTDKEPAPNFDPGLGEIVTSATKKELLDTIQGLTKDEEPTSFTHFVKVFLDSTKEPGVEIETGYDTAWETQHNTEQVVGTVGRNSEAPTGVKQQTFYKLVFTPDKTLEIVRTTSAINPKRHWEEYEARERERHDRFIRELWSGDREALANAEASRTEERERERLDIEATRRAERELGLDLVTEQEARNLIEELRTATPRALDTE